MKILMHQWKSLNRKKIIRNVLFNNSFKWTVNRITILLLSGFIYSNMCIANENESLEVKLKAAYIYNFLRFVEWPVNDDLNTNICVYGVKENYRSAFNSMSSLSKNSKKLDIKLLSVNEELNSLKFCQIIFITDKAEYKNKEILNHTKDSNSLTIGESPDFIQEGGMINFVRVKDKVKFEINIDAAKAADLKIPSKVLRIAERLVSIE
jgi:uncharacterized protein DUF4154